MEYGIEKLKIDFGISRINMNVGDSITVRPYDEVEDTSLVVVVGAPDENLHVGELTYDIGEKSTFPFPPKKTGEIPFEDSLDYWAQEDIAAATELDIVGGYDDGEFKPNNNVTRAEFAACLFEL